MIIATKKESYGSYGDYGYHIITWETIKGGFRTIGGWIKRLFGSAGEDLYARCGELKMGDKDSDRGGTKGDCVKILQDYLWRLGYYQKLYPDTYYSKDVDGIFGRRTWEAVGLFQKEHGLPPTGIVDKATWLALLGAVGTKPEVVVYQPTYVPVYVPTPTPAPAPAPKPTPTPPPPVKAEGFPWEKYLPFVMIGMAGVILYVALTRR